MKRGLLLPATAAALAAWLAAAGSAQAAPGAHGPGGEHVDGAAAAPATGVGRLPDGSVRVPKLAQRRLGLRTVVARPGRASATAELNARVVIDPNAGGRVQATYRGVVEPGPRGLPVVGQAVRKGETLAFVRHQAEPFAEADQRAQLAELRTAREVAGQRVRRLESLEGTTPRKDIDAARAELAGLAARERSIGDSLGARAALAAPVSGVVARADVLAGQVVEARELLFEIVDPSRLLVEASVADPALAGRIEDARLAGQDGHALRLVGVGRVLREGVLPLIFRAQAAPGAAPLAVGQPVTVVARLRDQVEGVVLPAAAVVRSPANEPVVWIKSGAERFVAQPVEVRPLDVSTVVVTRGLAADRRVVVQGAALVNQIR